MKATQGLKNSAKNAIEQIFNKKIDKLRNNNEEIKDKVSKDLLDKHKKLIDQLKSYDVKYEVLKLEQEETKNKLIKLGFEFNTNSKYYHNTTNVYVGGSKKEELTSSLVSEFSGEELLSTINYRIDSCENKADLDIIMKGILGDGFIDGDIKIKPDLLMLTD